METYEVKVSDCGDVYWYQNEKLSRLDGPAMTTSCGRRYWALNGDLHREDGPAVECAFDRKEWWLNGVNYSEEEHAKLTTPSKEMTLAEIEKELGYKIKVIK